MDLSTSCYMTTINNTTFISRASTILLLEPLNDWCLMALIQSVTKCAKLCHCLNNQDFSNKLSKLVGLN